VETLDAVMTQFLSIFETGNQGIINNDLESIRYVFQLWVRYNPSKGLTDQTLAQSITRAKLHSNQRPFMTTMFNSVHSFEDKNSLDDVTSNRHYSYASPPRSFRESDSPKSRTRKKRPDLDLTVLFFEDMERQPTIDGRNQYLPLIRRVQFKVMWQDIASSTDASIVSHLIEQTRQAITAFEILCVKYGTPIVDIALLGSQLELFFDDPSLVMPDALSQSLENFRDMSKPTDQTFTEAGWRVVYLLSLLPPAMRKTPLPAIDKEAITAFIKDRLNVADESQKTLVNGTLRYVTNVAASYIGRGIPYLDLISEGYFGLLRATETFREYMGGHFQQHAATWIHQKINRALSDQGLLIRQPVHLMEKARSLHLAVERFQDLHARLPHVHELEALDYDDEENLDGPGSDEKASAKLKLNRRRLFQYMMQANGPQVILDLVDQSSYQDSLLFLGEDILVESEQQYIGDKLWLREIIEAKFTSLLEKRLIDQRKWQILQLRIGWIDGENQTLEEIGQRFGVTRERIRQIEAGFIRTLEKLGFKQLLLEYSGISVDRHEYVYHRISIKFNRRLSHADLVLGSYLSGAWRERRIVEALIEKHVKRARRGQKRSLPRTSYSSLLIDALSQVERPAYYKQVYTKVLEIAPDSVQFSPQAVYAALYTSSRVRSLGNGYFDLEIASPGDKYSMTMGEKTLLYCPRPMIADSAHPRAFLESALRIQDYLRQGQVVPIHHLLRIEMEWAKDPKKSAPQDAIDAWYAAQLIEWIDYQFSPQALVKFALPQPLKIQELRVWCLSAICTRIVKNFDILAILDRVTALTTQEIQKFVFGASNRDFDMRNRLEMLAAFDAVREERNTWMITDIGRGVVNARSETDLPDLEALNTVQSDVESERQMDNLDDLDIFDL
jgi:RNA polymerase sigma factor (sigma-70 family)